MTKIVFPPGYKPWMCSICTATCNFEAMSWCARNRDPAADCGHENDRPESNGGAFEFMIKIGEHHENE